MSEEFTRKRQRDDEDDYEPQNDGISSSLPPHLMTGNNNYDGSTLPPHLQNDASSITTYPSHENTSRDTGKHESYGEYQDGGYYNQRKRARRLNLTNAEVQRAHELCNTLQILGDPVVDAKILAQCTETLSYFWSDSDFANNLLKFIGATIVEMPHKAVLFSGLIMLSNAKNDQIGKSLFLWLKERINDVFNSMEKNDMELEVEDEEMKYVKSWSRIILIMRMLGLLSPIIEDIEFLIKLFEDLLELSIKLQESKSERSKLGQLIYYEVTISIPYLLINNKENTELKEKCSNLLTIAKKFEVKEDVNDDYCKPIAEGEGISCIPMTDILKITPEATENYLNDISMFYDIISVVNPLITAVLTEKELAISKERGDDIVESTENSIEITKHSIGEFKLPNFEVLIKYDELNEFVSSSDKLWKNYKYFINVFPNEQTRKILEFDTTPPITSYVSMILNDMITNLLTSLEYNRVTLSKQFINFQRFFNEKIFAKSNAPIDKLMIVNDLNKGLDFDLVSNLESSTDFEDHIKNQMINSAKRIQYEFEEGFKSTWKLEEVILENIINFIFLLPESDLSFVYFESILTDTCGRDWTLSKRLNNHSNESLLFSKLIADCFRYFYEHIEKLEYENIVRFIKWFTFQISNFKFEWTWEEWISDVIQLGEEKIYTPKLFFIKNSIHKEILITNFKYIINRTLPIDLKKFANLSLNNRDELIEYDSKFFGEEFANSNTINPFEKIEEEPVIESNSEVIVETNTDTYKLFSHYLFNHDEHPYNDICRDIYMNLENVEESVESLIELCNKLKEKIENDEIKIVNNSEEYIITLIVQSICLIGSRSFSVFEESLNKVFGEKLNNIMKAIEDTHKELWIINAVLRIWNSEPRIGFMFIEKLFKFGIIGYESVIDSVWNCSKNSILPLSEIYADEFLNNIINYADEEDGEEEMEKQRDMIKIYLNNAIGKLNLMCGEVGQSDIIKYLEGLGENSLDEEWGLKNLIGLIKSKIRKYKSFDKIDFMEIFSGVEDESIKELFIKGVGL